MLFLKDKERKIIFGWSAKCGCTHIKKIFYYLQNGVLDNPVHKKEEYDKGNFTFEKDDYIILFIRNPYERLVSGYLNKYNEGSSIFARAQWRPDKELTFKNFVEELTRNNFQTLNAHHFTPQLSEDWTDKIKEHNNLTIFDINNIQEYFFDKSIPPQLKEKTGDNKDPIKEDFNFEVYNATMINLKGLDRRQNYFITRKSKEMLLFSMLRTYYFLEKGVIII